MIPARSIAGPAPIVGVVGAGVTGRVVAAHLAAAHWRVAVADEAQPASATDLAVRVSGVAVDAAEHLAAADVVVLCHPPTHLDLAEWLLRQGTSLVSLSDDLGDLDDLVRLDALARSFCATLVVGAGMSPGLTGLLARSLAPQVPVLEEIHIAVHGTGGPACAHQHHSSLGQPGLAWHDGAWLERPGGSGRELCWFPEPVGARDCYRAALADPRALHRCFPAATRISARVSANRRDRLTARLPMLVPPRAGGDEGAVRVEVRGADGTGARVTVVIGVAGRVGDIAGATAAAAATAVVERSMPSGAVLLGGADLDNASLLTAVQHLGLRLQEFTGVARAGW